ncbi:MAG: UDP-2,3-diacylglucosamine hydrolase [Calditrichaeota bacterium]|nr:UDP-2,3-diacylglucosamine hydrolase [Calditrichota bacterium]
MQTSPERRALIIADAHLPLDGRSGAGHKFARLIELLDHYRDTLALLILLGDTFDFWYEWGQVVPKRAFPLLAKLRALVDDGIPVHIFAGNHDFKLDSFLHDEVGAEIHMDGWRITLDGRRYYFHHGDGFAASDRNYHRMKGVFRNATVQALFGGVLHPDLAMKVGRFVSRFGEEKARTLDAIQPPYPEYEDTARRLLENGNDVVVIGHLHIPFTTKLEQGVFLNPGPFLEMNRYGLIEGDLPRSEVWR